jgi:hypothetical protein
VELHENDIGFHEISYEDSTPRCRRPETRNLKPMLGEGFIAPDNVKKGELFS